jgi:hypothetical protein
MFLKKANKLIFSPCICSLALSVECSDTACPQYKVPIFLKPTRGLAGFSSIVENSNRFYGPALTKKAIMTISAIEDIVTS